VPATRLLLAQGFVDLYNYLLRQRIIFLSGYVNDKVSSSSSSSALAAAAAAAHWQQQQRQRTSQQREQQC
jgi:ATP-dependent protease ClpP protease subunit